MEGLLMRFLAAPGAPCGSWGVWKHPAIQIAMQTSTPHRTASTWESTLRSAVPKTCGLATCRCDRGKISTAKHCQIFLVVQVRTHQHSHLPRDRATDSSDSGSNNREMGRGKIDPKTAVSRAVTNDLAGAGAGVTSTLYIPSRDCIEIKAQLHMCRHTQVYSRPGGFGCRAVLVGVLDGVH